MEPKWFGSRRFGMDPATEAAQNKLGSRGFQSVRRTRTFFCCGDLLYSLDKAEMRDDSSEGRAECVRRQYAAKFNGRVQQCDGDGVENNVMESKSTDYQ